MAKPHLQLIIKLIQDWVKSGKLERDHADHILRGIKKLLICANAKSPSGVRREIDDICEQILKGLNK